MKKLISVLLVLALMVSVLGVMPITASAVSGDNIVLDFESNYLNVNDTAFYTGQTNYVGGTNRGSTSAIVADGNNKAMILTYDSDNGNENYKANPAFAIYDTATKARFVGESGKYYKISFDVKITNTDNRNMQFYVANCNRANGDFWGTDMNLTNSSAMNNPVELKAVAAGAVFTEPTEGYVTVSTYFLSNGSDYPIIALTTNNKTQATNVESYAAAYVDNVRVTSAPEEFTVDFDYEFLNASGKAFYSDGNNFGSGGRGGAGSVVDENNDGNKSAVLTYDNENNENYSANPGVFIFDPATRAPFVGENGYLYKITLKAKVYRNEGVPMQLHIVNCGRSSLGSSNLSFYHSGAMSAKEIKDIKFGPEYTATTNDYETLECYFLSNGSDKALIGLVTNNNQKTALTGNFAAMIIDDIVVSKIGPRDSANNLHTNFEIKHADTSKHYYAADGTNNFFGQSTWTSFYNRASNASWVTEADGNQAVRLSYKSYNARNYKDNPALAIYNTATKTQFKGTEGKHYIINFSYKVENTDNRKMELYVVGHKRSGDAIGSTDLNFNSSALGNGYTVSLAADIKGVTDGYVNVSVPFTGAGVPIILLRTNDGQTVSGHSETGYASVLIDDISVIEVAAPNTAELSALTASILTEEAEEAAGAQAMRVYASYSINNIGWAYYGGKYQRVTGRGILIILKENLGENELNKSLDKVTDLAAENLENYWAFDKQTNTLTFSNFLYNFKPEYEEKELSFNAYLVLHDGEKETVVYSGRNDFSVKELRK